MKALVIAIVLVIYEWISYRPKTTGRYILLSLYSLAVLASIWFFPSIFVVWIYIAYLVHHHFLLHEEKVYAGLLSLVSSLFLILSLNNTWILYACAGTYALLEYMSRTIMQREEDKTVIYQNKLMKQQIDEIENIYKTMRDWRHDYHNHLQSLKGYLRLGQYEAMEKYLNELETDLDSIDTLYHSGNLQLDAVLDAKLSLAMKDDITVKCDAQLPPKLTVNDIDLCIIIGNLLDNAVESCRKIPDPKDRFIRIYINVLKKQLYISITNATNESVKVRNGNYFTNKRGDHGRGLHRVDNTVKKYDGLLNRQNEPGVFATEILLPL